MNSFLILIVLLLCFGLAAYGQDDGCCANYYKEICPACPKGSLQSCKDIPAGKKCGGTCTCFKNGCKYQSDCNGKKGKCKGNTAKPFMSCDYTSGVNKECVCTSGQVCDGHKDCTGEFTKQQCKSGEIGACKAGPKCTCIKDVGTGNECTNEECQAILDQYIDNCFKDSHAIGADDKKATLAAKCANYGNKCYDKCVATHKCRREREDSTIEFANC